MNENKRLIKNTGLIAIGNIGTRLISFFLLPLYTALLTTSEYGICDYIVAISTFCVPFVTLLMDESIFRFLIDCNSLKEKKQVITTSIALMISGLLIFSIISIPIMLLLNYSYTGYTIAYILLNAICGMFCALLRGIGRTDQFALYSFLLGGTQVLLNVLLIAVFKMGLKGMLLSTIVAQSLVTLIFCIKIRIWEYFDHRQFENKLAKQMIVYSLPLIPNRVSWNIINLSDRLVLMKVLGSDSSGLYAVSHKFPNLMDTVYGFFYQSWKESSARALGTENEVFFYNSVYTYLKSFMYSIVLGMSAFSPLIFRVMVNDKFNEAVLYVPILLIATFFSNISGFYGGVFTAHKNTGVMGISTIMGAGINLVINLVLIWYIGIYAAAISTLVSSFIVCIYRWYKVREYIRLKENPYRICISVVTTAIVLLAFYNGSITSIMLSCIVSIIYAAAFNYRLIYRIFRYLWGKYNVHKSK